MYHCGGEITVWLCSANTFSREIFRKSGANSCVVALSQTCQMSSLSDYRDSGPRARNEVERRRLEPRRRIQPPHGVERVIGCRVRLGKGCREYSACASGVPLAIVRNDRRPGRRSEQQFVNRGGRRTRWSSRRQSEMSKRVPGMMSGKRLPGITEHLGIANRISALSPLAKTVL